MMKNVLLAGGEGLEDAHRALAHHVDARTRVPFAEDRLPSSEANRPGDARDLLEGSRCESGKQTASSDDLGRRLVHAGPTEAPEKDPDLI